MTLMQPVASRWRFRGVLSPVRHSLDQIAGSRVGWFVVGAGRNGMEFSTLLIICLVVIAMTAPAAYVLGRRSGR
ncbi:MAG: hypothetical protein LC804_11270 [Acidobacteria bacterium]|nr:hypothetical protein [Acidobacteriota bacterium]